MSFRRIVIAGLATTALAGVATANDTYTCGDQVCYDDQADETRRLNEAQLENPGAGADAVPDDGDDEAYDDGYDGGYDGQGGLYEPQEPDDSYDGDGGYDDGPEDDDEYDDMPDDDEDDEKPPQY